MVSRLLQYIDDGDVNVDPLVAADEIGVNVSVPYPFPLEVYNHVVSDPNLLGCFGSDNGILGYHGITADKGGESKVIDHPASGIFSFTSPAKATPENKSTTIRNPARPMSNLLPS